MQTIQIPKGYQHVSPAGAEVRLLMNNRYGGIAHCTLRNNKISKAVRHRSVSEFWHILAGSGEIWRRFEGVESVTPLVAEITIDIPLGTDFQYRSARNTDLVFICVTMPPWPGEDEVTFVENGCWLPKP